MSTYIVNTNGDWWQYHQSQEIMALDTDSLRPEELAEIVSTWGQDWECQDKFEQVIMQYGYPVSLRFKGELA